MCSAPSGKEPACPCRRHETQVQSLGPKDSLEEEMATHSSILAWEIPGTEESGGLQSMGSQRATHTCTYIAYIKHADGTTAFSMLTYTLHVIHYIYNLQINS